MGFVVAYAWYAERTPARARALRPLAPLVAMTAIVGAVAVGHTLAGSSHRTVEGEVVRRFEVPWKQTRMPYLEVRGPEGDTPAVPVPRALWDRCPVGAHYARAAMSDEVRCGDTTMVDTLDFLRGVGLLWGILVASLAMAMVHRISRIQSGE